MYFLLLVVCASTLTTIPLFQNTMAGALVVNSDSPDTYDEQVKAILYYGAATWCFSESRTDDAYITGSPYKNIISYNSSDISWGLDNRRVGTGVYLNGQQGIERDDGSTYCNNSFINNAMSYLGISPKEFLCEVSTFRDYSDNKGATGYTGTDCINKINQPVTDPASHHYIFVLNGSNEDFANSFAKYVQKKVYGDENKRPSLTDAQKYIFYRNSLYVGCMGQSNPGNGNSVIQPNSDQPSSSTNKSKILSDIQWVQTAGEVKIIPGWYLSDFSPGSYITIRPWNDIVSGDYNPSSSQVSPTRDGVDEQCKTLSNNMAKYASAYLAEYIKWKNINEEAEKKLQEEKADTTDSTNNCGEHITGIGWIVCPIINSLSSMNDGMWNLTQSLLKVNPLNQSDKIYEAWGTIRNIANVLFVIAFLFIVFSQTSNLGISNYGIKKMLPRLIISAILVNISFLAVQIAVDLANIAGSGIYDLISKAAPPVGKATWGTLLGDIIAAGGAITVAGVATVAASGGIVASILLLLPALVAGMFGLVAALVTLMFRQAAIPVLAILAPIAFVAFLLPNTEGWYKKWQGMFISMLMLYPLAAVIFAGAEFAAGVIINAGGWFNGLTGMIILTLPLFSIPFLASKSSAFASTISGKVKTMFSKPQEGINKWAGKEAEYAANKRNTRMMNNPNSFQGRFLRYQTRRKAINDTQVSEFERAKTGYIADTVASDSKFRGQMVAGGVAGSADRALAKAESTRSKLLGEENAAAEILVKNLSQDDIRTLNNGGTVGNLDAGSSLAIRSAAWKKTFDSGDVEGINSVINSTSGLSLGHKQAFSDIASASSGRPSYLSQGALARLRADEPGFTINSDELIKKAIDSNAYSVDKIATSSEDELKEVFRVAADTSLGTNNQNLIENVKIALSNPSYAGKISKQRATIETAARGFGLDPDELRKASTPGPK